MEDLCDAGLTGETWEPSKGNTLSETEELRHKNISMYF